MSPETPQEIAPGTVVEFFEAKQILCGVCLATKNQRLTVLTELNKEISLARSRAVHSSGHTLNLKLSRDELVQRLAAISALRRKLTEGIDLEEVWSLFESNEEGYEARELTEFVFPTPVSDDQIAAMQRLLLLDHLYFQFKDGRFIPRQADKVEQRRMEGEREAEREAQLEEGSEWLHAIWNRKGRPPATEGHAELIAILKDFAVFGQEAPEQAFLKELFKRAAIPPQPQSAFRLLVRLGIWHEDENLYLHEQGITADFPAEVLARAETAARVDLGAAEREDLRHLETFTIDSALTRDYDDALSLAVLPGGEFEVGIHIADAAEFIARDDRLDQEAQLRASTIYLPDQRIAMLPHALSEGVCSLKAGEDRLALSFLLRMDASGAILEKRIVPSLVRVREQLTYEQVNERVGEAEHLRVLHELAAKLRQERLDRGAIILPLPEIQVHVKPGGMIQITRYEKETPSQIMVSEWMIAANALAADFLSEHKIPGIFRGQGECKPETDLTQSPHEIFHIYRKRRLFARAEVDTEPKAHCSLALQAYTTVTSPIRRYTDLVVQRQIKHALRTEAALYTEEELRQLITRVGAILSKVFLIQRKWNRYWILKYLEQEDPQSLNAIVLDQNERFAHLLLPDFLVETNVPLTDRPKPQSGELIRVRIDRINPREDILRVVL